MPRYSRRRRFQFPASNPDQRFSHSEAERTADRRTSEAELQSMLRRRARVRPVAANSEHQAAEPERPLIRCDSVSKQICRRKRNCARCKQPQSKYKLYDTISNFFLIANCRICNDHLSSVQIFISMPRRRACLHMDYTWLLLLH